MPSNSPTGSQHKLSRDAGDGGPTEAAAFIATTLADLKLIAQRHQLETLTYLLDLAHLEARDGLPNLCKPGEA